MDESKKKKVLKILEYWKMVELLSQVDIPLESNDNKKHIKDVVEGKTDKSKPPIDKLDIFNHISIEKEKFELEEIISVNQEVNNKYPFLGGEIAVIVVEIKRNDFVEHLGKYFNPSDNQIDLSYPDNSMLAWCSYKLDHEGKYVEKSFKLSPILWAAAEWNKLKKVKNMSFSLEKSEYDAVIDKINDELIKNFNEAKVVVSDANSVNDKIKEINNYKDLKVSDLFNYLYENVYEEYVKPIFPVITSEYRGEVIYTRYLTEEAREKDDGENNYADLGRSYYVNDIILFESLVKSGEIDDKDKYQQSIINYILSADEKSKGMDYSLKTIISPTEDRSKLKKFFGQVLKTSNAPIGKWPSKFMPVLMQQVAVNIAINEKDDNTPVFSVNGPPGTGKTTLLKEIVANNIVERAKLLAAVGDNPDDAFEKKTFLNGPSNSNSYFKFAPAYYSIKNDKINEYGMLVTSCNNSAVENITVDLPKGSDILGSLDFEDEKDEDVKKGLEEVHDLFDVSKSTDIETITHFKKKNNYNDIYFTRYANDLLDKNDSWGLVSAPFGKRFNINKYCDKVLTPFVKDYNSNEIRDAHLEKYHKCRKDFLTQLKKVEAMQKELDDIASIGEKIPDEKGFLEKTVSKINLDYQQIDSLDEEIGKLNKEIAELEQNKPKGFILFKRKQLKEYEEKLNNAKKQIKKNKAIKAKHEYEIESNEVYLKYREELKKHSEGAEKFVALDSDFLDNYVSTDEKTSTKAQVTNPWFTARYNREREKLFYFACKLNKEFVISSKCMRQNIINFMIAYNKFSDAEGRMSYDDKEAAMPDLLQSIFLLTPVISTTFASAQSFLSNIKKPGTLGFLIVDEAGQAQPQMALGSLFRCRKAVIVGDPKQIEPVVTAEADMIKQLFTGDFFDAYKNKKISVQGFADYINPYGTILADEEEKEWVGCPLVVHRRCIDPMYTVSNTLSYNMTMKQQTELPKEKVSKTFILDESLWINVKGNEESGDKNHFVARQGELVLLLLEKKLSKLSEKEVPKLYIITPFTSVKNGMKSMLKRSDLYKNDDRVKKWLEENNIGTVHTFQGKGTDEVIFLLGCDEKSTKAADWVNKNIVNVAATRAKFRFYVIGDKDVWMCKPVKIAREVIGKTITEEELRKELDTEGSYTKADNTDYGVCPRCGRKLVNKDGKKGEFIGCTGYPNCKFSKNLK